jgi:hypothetical protein
MAFLLKHENEHTPRGTGVIPSAQARHLQIRKSAGNPDKASAGTDQT